jgi:hypothetical protein
VLLVAPWYQLQLPYTAQTHVWFELLLLLLLCLLCSFYVCLQLLFPVIGLGQEASPTALKESDRLITINLFDEVVTPTAAAKAARSATRAAQPGGACVVQLHACITVNAGHDNTPHTTIHADVQLCDLIYISTFELQICSLRCWLPLPGLDWCGPVDVMLCKCPFLRSYPAHTSCPAHRPGVAV